MSNIECQSCHTEHDISEVHDFDIYNPGALQRASFNKRQHFWVTDFWGHLKCIVNNKGKVVDPTIKFLELETVGYIEFAIDNTDYRLYYAQGAAIKRILVPMSDDKSMYTFVLARSEFHEVHYRTDLRCLTGKIGASTYIVDPQSGESCSDGYHKIYRLDNIYWGTQGAKVEQIPNIQPLKNF